MLYHLISEDFIDAIGWTVVHSLWQGILIALIMMLVLFFLQKKSSNTRYWVANLALVSILMTSIWTFFSLFEQQSVTSDEGLMLLFNQETAAFLAETGQLSFIDYYSQQFANYFNEHLPLIVMIWGIGVAFFILRLFGGLFYVEYLKYNFNTPLEDVWQDKLQTLQDKIPVQKTVALMESALIKVPMVMGYFKPMILLPIGIVNALDSEQIEAILAHELAHISRNDFLINILQSVVEVLFYFNPAVWWISANIRMERENCCDDIAVNICGNSLTYAKALVSIQEMNQSAPSFAMTFSGGRQKNQLLNRVKRILHQPQNKSNIMEKFMATCLLLVAFVAWSLQANNSINPLEGNNTDIFQQNMETPAPLTETVAAVGEEEEIYIETVFIKQDTVPKGTRQFHHNKGDQDIEMQLDGDEIIKLKVNGKTIPKEDMDNYKDLVTELIEDLDNMKVPTPPAPPSPPVAPHLNGIVVPMPPMPPSSPAAPSFRLRNSSDLIQTEDENGNTFYIIEDENGSIIEDKNGNALIAPNANHFLLNGNAFEFSDLDFKIDNTLEDGLHFLETDAFVYEDLSSDLLGTVTEVYEDIIFDNKFGDHVIFIDTLPSRELSQEERMAKDEARKARKEMQEELVLLKEEQRTIQKEYREEMNVKMKEFREKERVIQQELREQQKDLIKEQREIHLERSKIMRDEARTSAKEARAEVEERRNILEKDREIYRLDSGNGETKVWAYDGKGRVSSGDLRQIFEKQLIADGTIKKTGDAYKLELSGDKMTIDGQKQSDTILEKYKTLYQSSTGSSLKAEDNVSIRVKSNGSVSTSIQIEDEE